MKTKKNRTDDSSAVRHILAPNLTPDLIDQLAIEKSISTEWGWEVYLKDGTGAWYQDHLLIPEPAFRRTHKVYLDERASEIIPWADPDEDAKAVQAHAKRLEIRQRYQDATNFGRADDRLSRAMSAVLSYWRDSYESEACDRQYDGGEWSGPAHEAIRLAAQDLIALDYGFTDFATLILAAKKVCSGRQLWLMGFSAG